MTGVRARPLVAEFVGTAVLLAAVVGSGISTVADGPTAQLFRHAVVVGAALIVLVLVFGPVSGAHLNPAVTAADWWFGGLTGGEAAGYVTAQLTGALAGTVATSLMFGHGAVATATTARDGLGLIGGEALATAGLVVVIFALVHTEQPIGAVAAAVGTWIGAAIYFTASASFANPAVTLARAVTDTWTGIAPASVPGFLAGQAAGTAVAMGLVAWMYRPSRAEAQEVVVPHNRSAGAAADRSAAGTEPPDTDRT